LETLSKTFRTDETFDAPQEIMNKKRMSLRGAYRRYHDKRVDIIFALLGQKFS